MDMLRVTASWLMVLLLVFGTEARYEYLFFSTPGDNYHAPGFYGGPLEFRGGRLSYNIYKYGYHCAKLGNIIREGLNIKYTSIDYVTHEVLFQLQQHPGFLTLTRGPLCEAKHVCENNNQEVIFHNAHVYDPMGPFVQYASKLYFLVTRDIDYGPGEKERSIELRVLEGCKELYPVTMSTAFKIDACSKYITTIQHEKYSVYSSYAVTAGFIAIRGRQDVEFFVQLKRVLRDDESINSFSMHLYHVTGRGVTKKLHTQNVRKDYTRYVELYHIGSISHLSGKVCWSAIDRIMCADWKREKLENEKLVVRPGQASRVCSAPIGDEILADMITGISIAQTQREMAIYFGCIAHSKVRGGAGFLQWNPHDRKPPQFRPLVTNTSRIYAGSVFYTDVCHKRPGYAVSLGVYGRGTESSVSPLLIAILVFLSHFILKRM